MGRVLGPDTKLFPKTKSGDPDYSSWNQKCLYALSDPPAEIKRPTPSAKSKVKPASNNTAKGGKGGSSPQNPSTTKPATKPAATKLKDSIKEFSFGNEDHVAVLNPIPSQLQASSQP